MKKFLFVSILSFLFSFSFSLSEEIKREEIPQEIAHIDSTLPEEGETKYNMPFSALFEKKGEYYYNKDKVCLSLGGFFTLTLGDTNKFIGDNVRINGKNIDEIAKGTFTITKIKNIYIMTEESGK